MNVEAWATRLFFGESLADKLFIPEETLIDQPSGNALAWSEPGRASHLRIAAKKDRKPLPKPSTLDRVEQRVKCLHTFANHELMAIELMAFALLAFPDAPDGFRNGLIHILQDEQRHFAMYAERIEALGATFGDFPINDHFWRVAPTLTNPLKWVCAMNLTFEQANLDHAPVFAHYFRDVEDELSASLMDIIVADEIDHVAFGAHMLKNATPDDRTTFEIYTENLTFHNEPSRARGRNFYNADARRKAGLDDDFVTKLGSIAS